MSEIIGFAGQFSTGKDTAADYLVKKLNELSNKKWQRIAFASAVKKVFMNSFNVDKEFIEEWKRKEKIPEGFNIPIRKALQFIGDGFRQIKSDIWIDIAFRNNTNSLIISDVRYINEAKVIRGGLRQGRHLYKGYNVLLWRNNFENDDPSPSEAQIMPLVKWCLNTGQNGVIFGKKNIPEGISDFDYFLKNDGNIDDLYRKIDCELLPEILKYFNEGITI